MAALIQPSESHDDARGVILGQRLSALSRPAIGSPPRSGSVARSCAGQQGRANLRLVGPDEGVNSGVAVNLKSAGVGASGEGIGERLRDLMATPVQELWPAMSLARGVNYTLGMVVAIALVPLLAVGTLWAVSSALYAPLSVSGASSGPAPVGPGDRVVVVGPGDSLWTIAATVAPEVDRRDAVRLIKEANDSTAELQIGQSLIIPAELIGS